MIQMHLEGAKVLVQPLPEGARLLMISDPQSGIQIVCGLSAEAAKEIGGLLIASGVQIARVLPPENGRR